MSHPDLRWAAAIATRTTRSSWHRTWPPPCTCCPVSRDTSRYPPVPVPVRPPSSSDRHRHQAAAAVGVAATATASRRRRARDPTRPPSTTPLHDRMYVCMYVVCNISRCFVTQSLGWVRAALARGRGQGSPCADLPAHPRTPSGPRRLVSCALSGQGRVQWIARCTVH